MKIITIDPGLQAWALAIFEDGKLITSKTLNYKKEKLSQEVRLWLIFDTLCDYYDAYDLELGAEVVCERQFVDTMSQITGVVKAFAGKYNLKSILYVPKQWKKVISGRGDIDEEKLKSIVCEKYPELQDKSEHEVDCAGIYMAHRLKTCNQ